jgi:hypothetical protein
MVTLKCQCGSSSCSVTGGVDSNGALIGAALSGQLAAGQWQVVLQTSCCCDAKIDILVSCPAYPGCQAASTVLLPCATCCPKITIETIPGECDAAGQSTVTFIVKLDTPAGCPPVTAYMDFGDGSAPSATHSFAPPSSTFTWTHAYSSGTWLAQVLIAAPDNCPGKSASVTVTCPKEDCCPDILSIGVEQGPCDALGQAQVTLNIHYSVPDNCPPAQIQVDFGLGPLGAVHTISGTGTIVETPVYPAGSYTGAILVHAPRGCQTQIFPIEVNCPDCCPTVSAIVEKGLCVDGALTATFIVNVTVPKGCPPATVQLDFGDGSHGVPHSFAASGSYSETHSYSNGSYPAAVDVLAPAGCPPKPVPVTVECPPDCCPKLSMTAEQGECDAKGNAPVKFTIHYSVAAGCPPAEIQLDFGHGPLGAVHTVSGSGTIVQTHVYPAGAYTAAVLVHKPTGCAAYALQFQVNCPNCCPTVSVKVEQGDCKNGSLTATFTVNVTVPPGCPPAVVQLDFGDGSYGAAHSFAGSGSYSETHGYATGSYPAAVNTIVPSGCPPKPAPVTVECVKCCPTLSVKVKKGECKNGSQTATFVVGVTVPPGCPAAVVQLDFGDGSQGALHSFAVSGSYTEIHSYTSGSYSAAVNVIAPAGCAPHKEPIEVDCPDCCPDLSTEVKYGPCGEDGNAVVTLITTVTPKPKPCPPAQVQVDWGGGNLGAVHTFATPGSFSESATFSAGPHSAAVNVLVPSDCKPKPVNIFVPCTDCCPSVSVSPCIPDCTLDADRTVDFQITVGPKGSPCPPKAVSFQMDFGDGTQGQSVTIPAGGSAYTYTETHTYAGAAALQDNNAELIVSQPPECAGSYGSVLIPKCCKPKRAAFCVTLLWAMSATFAVAVLFLLYWLLGSAYPTPPNWQNWFFALASLGVAMLIVYLMLCTKCRCGWVWVLLWRVFFAAGLFYAIFAACAFTSTSMLHWLGALIGVLMVLLAFFFLWLWWKKCCVSLCKLLSEIFFLAVFTLGVVGTLSAYAPFTACLYVIPIPNNPIKLLVLAGILFTLFSAYYATQCLAARRRG